MLAVEADTFDGREPFVDAATVGEFLGVSARTVQRWAKDADFLPAYRLGNRALRFRLSEVEQWAKANRAGN